MKITKQRVIIALSVLFLLIGLYLAFLSYQDLKLSKAEILTLQETKKSSLVVADKMQYMYLSKTDALSMLPQYTKLFEQNSDIIGWLTVDGTQIDLPVMQNQTDNEYYLRRGFDGQFSKAGLPFLDLRCNSASDNLIIYGHNMKNGTMFAGLMNYADNDYYEKHKTFQFDTLYEQQSYEIVAVFYSEILNRRDKSYRFYNFTKAQNHKQYDELVDYILKNALYDTGIIPKHGDKLITLITCSYHTENGRIAVVARKIKGGD